MPTTRLKKRAGFLNAAAGVYLPRAAFTLQRNVQAETETPRFGFTVTKKVGNAVVRNRVKRRLKEAVARSDRSLLQPCFDYVIIGRQETLTIPFKTLCAEIETGLKKLARGDGRPSRKYRNAQPRATKP